MNHPKWISAESWDAKTASQRLAILQQQRRNNDWSHELAHLKKVFGK